MGCAMSTACDTAETRLGCADQNRWASASSPPPGRGPGSARRGTSAWRAEWMCTLNRAGAPSGRLAGVRKGDDRRLVSACSTHLGGMADGSKTHRTRGYAALPRLASAEILSGAGLRAWAPCATFDSYGRRIAHCQEGLKRFTILDQRRPCWWRWRRRAGVPPPWRGTRPATEAPIGGPSRATGVSQYAGCLCAKP